MKKNYVKKCLMVSLALSMTVATVTFADTLTGDGYANEQETEVYTAGTPDLTTHNVSPDSLILPMLSHSGL